MKKHIHIHLPSKPQVAALLRPKAITRDATLRELKSKRKLLEEEFDKADNSGDNHQTYRLRKELAALVKMISDLEEKKEGTKDAHERFFNLNQWKEEASYAGAQVKKVSSTEYHAIKKGKIIGSFNTRAEEGELKTRDEKYFKKGMEV